MANPLSAARQLKTNGHIPTLLLSAHATRYGTRSLLAIQPDETIISTTGAGLPAIPPRLVHAAGGEGVWIGAIAYDAGLDLLGITSRHTPADPAVLAHYHRTYAVHDTAADSWELIGPDGPAHTLLNAAIHANDTTATNSTIEPRTATTGLTRTDFAEQARAVQHLISSGEVFEVNLTQLLRTPWSTGGWDLFERLVAVAPSDHAAYLASDGYELASISPEVFLHINDGRAETRPIKGTRRRGQTPAEDDALATELVASAKDRAENMMIVDLLRNDLTATAEPGSVQVVALCELERTEHVMHLVSTIEARVRDDVRLPDVLVSCFPGGSITGAPKRRAMELIDRLEADPRGFYCGSVFAYEPARNALTASVAIRTATVSNGEARYGAGGAITLLSDPSEEAEEALLKAQPFLRATNATLAGWDA